jgi:biopolymer transport protein TolR
VTRDYDGDLLATSQDREEWAQRGIYLKPARHRGLTYFRGIDVTAFAGIMLALVAVFLLPAMLVDRHQHGPSADLPKVRYPTPVRGALRDDALVITVERDGRIFLGNDQVGADRLAAGIAAGLNRGAERRVYIRADAHARYGAVLDVLGSVRSVQMEQVTFLVDQRRATVSSH